MLTESQLQTIMPKLAQAKLTLCLPHLNAAIAAYDIDAPWRCAAFVAQLAHESGEFRWMEELWGPTDAQRRYEPPGDLAKKLGNTEPGDGKRFKGRGPIQITGRFNYQKYGQLLGQDLVAQPELAATPEIAFATAGLFWQTNGLNELADAHQFVTITRRINGGTNGLEDRQMYYERAQAALGLTTLTRGVPTAAAQTLARGAEVIRRALGEGAPAPRKAAGRKAAAVPATAPLPTPAPAKPSARKASPVARQATPAAKKARKPASKAATPRAPRAAPAASRIRRKSA